MFEGTLGFYVHVCEIRLHRVVLSILRYPNYLFDSHLRFFIAVKDDSGWADNRYVAFGRVVEGMDIVHKIEHVKVEGGTNKPKKPVVIDDCGLL